MAADMNRKVEVVCNISSGLQSLTYCLSNQTQQTTAVIQSNPSTLTEFLETKIIKTIHHGNESETINKYQASNTERPIWIITNTGDLYNINSGREMGKSYSDSEEQDDIFSELLDSSLESHFPLEVQTDPSRKILSSLTGVLEFFVSKDIIGILKKNNSIVSLDVYVLERGENDATTANFHIQHTLPFLFDETDLARIKLLNVCPGSSDDQVSLNLCGISTKLFTALFGKEIALLNSCVTIIAKPNGHIYTIPLKINAPIGKTNFQILCDIKDGVSDMFVVEYNDEISESANESKNCLAIIGNSGKILLIFCDDNGELMYRNTHVLGPILCSCLQGTNIIYSTGKSLFAADLSLAIKSQDEQFLNSFDLRIIGVHSLCPLKQGSRTTTGISVLAATQSGSILHLDQNIGDQIHDPQPKHLTSSLGNEMLKDLLTNTAKVSEKLASKAKEKEQLNELIQQLNVASCIARCKTKDQRVLVSAVAVNQKVYGTFVEFSMDVFIKNKGPISLNSDWTFHVVLRNDAALNLDSTPTFCDMNGISKLIHIQSLPTGSQQSVRFEINTDLLNCLPLYVETSLILNSTLVDSRIKVGFPLHLPLEVHKLNIMHFLSPATNPPHKPLPQKTDTFDIVQGIRSVAAESVASRFHEVNETEATSSVQRRIFNTVLQIPVSSVKKKLKSLKGKCDINTLLEYLTEENSYLAEIRKDVNKLDAQTPAGQRVNVVVTEVKSSTGSLSFQVDISTESVAAISQIRETVHDKLQDVVTVSSYISSMTAKDNLRQVQMLQKEMHNLNQTSSQQNDKEVQQNKLLGVYESLRKLNFS